MATSGNTSWELDRNGLIEASYRKLGIPGEGNTLSTTQYADGLVAVNSAITLAMLDGMPLWKRTVSTQTPSASSQVYTITDAIKIASVFLRDTSGSQYELIEKSLYDFKRLSTSAAGVPVHWTAQSTIAGYTVSIWPLTSDTTTVSSKFIDVIYHKKFDNFTSTTTDTLDFPSYWTTALVYKTAQLLAPENGIPLEDRKMLAAEAKDAWDMASDFGDEDGSLYIQPERRC